MEGFKPQNVQESKIKESKREKVKKVLKIFFVGTILAIKTLNASAEISPINNPDKDDKEKAGEKKEIFAHLQYGIDKYGKVKSFQDAERQKKYGRPPTVKTFELGDGPNPDRDDTGEETPTADRDHDNDRDIDENKSIKVVSNGTDDILYVETIDNRDGTATVKATVIDTKGLDIERIGTTIVKNVDENCAGDIAEHLKKEFAYYENTGEDDVDTQGNNVFTTEVPELDWVEIPDQGNDEISEGEINYINLVVEDELEKLNRVFDHYDIIQGDDPFVMEK